MAGVPTKPDASVLHLEYAEVCSSIRDCWKYIADLIRNFLLIQILLIGAVGLGGQVVSREALRDSESSSVAAAAITDGAPARSVSNPVEGRPTTATSPGNSGPTERASNYWKVVLALFGCIFSFGAWIQNQRLFLNAQIFIERGSRLEEEGGFLFKKTGKDADMPINSYMHARLSGKSGKKPWGTITALSWAYLGTAILWVIALIFYFLGGVTFPTGGLPF